MAKNVVTKLQHNVKTHVMMTKPSLTFNATVKENVEPRIVVPKVSRQPRVTMKNLQSTLKAMSNVNRKAHPPHLDLQQLDKTPEKIVKKKVKKLQAPLKRLATDFMNMPLNECESRAQYYVAAPMTQRHEENRSNSAQKEQKRFMLTSKKSRSSSYQRRIQQKRVCMSLDHERLKGALDQERSSITNRSERSNLSLSHSIQYRNSIRPINTLN